MTLPIRNNRIQLPQGRLFWREVGQGRTVVLLHGAWWTGEQWTEVIQSLSHNYQCVVPDLLGFGESEKPKTLYSIQLQVECLRDYLQVLRIKRCVLVGYGLGAWVAATLALVYPDAVSGLILMAPEGVMSEKLRHRWRGWSLLSSPIPLMGWFLRIRLAIATLLGDGRSPLSTLRRRRLLRQSPAACRLLFKRRRAELHAEYLQDKLANLRCPMLVLQSADDSPTTLTLCQIYAQAPHATVEVVPTLGTPEPWRQPSNSRDPHTIDGAIAPIIHTFISDLAKQPNSASQI